MLSKDYHSFPSFDVKCQNNWFHWSNSFANSTTKNKNSRSKSVFSFFNYHPPISLFIFSCQQQIYHRRQDIAATRYIHTTTVSFIPFLPVTNTLFSIVVPPLERQVRIRIYSIFLKLYCCICIYVVLLALLGGLLAFRNYYVFRIRYASHYRFTKNQ